VRYYIVYIIIIAGSYLIIPVLYDAYDSVSLRGLDDKEFLDAGKMCLYADLIGFFSILWKLSLVSLVLFGLNHCFGFIKKLNYFFILNLVVIVLLSFLWPFIIDLFSNFE
jgi:hypothetical protein